MTKEDFYRRIIDTDFLQTAPGTREASEGKLRSFMLGALQMVHDEEERNDIAENCDFFINDYFKLSKYQLRMAYCKGDKTLESSNLRRAIATCLKLVEKYPNADKKEFILGYLELKFTLSGNELDFVLDELDKENLFTFLK